MRLSIIFLGVLTVSVLITSLAAWGIIYGTSYIRVTIMSSDFSSLAHGMLAEFSGYVNALLQSNSVLLSSILTQEKALGEASMQQSKSDMVAAIGVLVNYTTNATDQSQRQMNTVVDTFATLMGRVVGEFRGLASGYTSQLRAGVAANIVGAIQTTMSVRAAVMQQYPLLGQLGMLNLSRTPSDPVGQDDCKLLATLCASQYQMAEYNFDNFTLALSTGKSYFCNPWYAAVNVRTANGSRYNEDLLMWMFDYDGTIYSAPSDQFYGRCMSQPPDVVKRVGQNCSPSNSCKCGIDERCTSWFQYRASISSQDYLPNNVTVCSTGVPCVSYSVSMVNDVGAPVLRPQVLAVLTGADNQGLGVEMFLRSLGASPTTVLALLANDAQLTYTASLSQKCAPNETAPGDPSLPLWSAFRSCDARLRWAAHYIAANQSALPPRTTVVHDGVVWDIFSITGLLRYFVVIGTLLSEINAAVDSTNAEANSELRAVRAEQLREVAAAGTAARAYVAEVGTQGVAGMEAMEAGFLAQIVRQDNTSRAALAASQRESESQVQQLTTEENGRIIALTTHHLHAMSETAGWTIAVVVGILLGVLLSSAWGTIRITLSLVRIIELMEDVALMRVEGLEVPHDSDVREVARIQTAFNVLIARLAEYKGYIPAGLFERGSGQEDGAGEKPGGGGGRENGGSLAPDVSHFAPHALSVPDGPPRPPDPPPASAGRPPRAARRNVAVLAVNVLGFMEVIGRASEGLAKSVFNDYITCVHQAVSLVRGHIDCILGDQIFVTFNAHIPCSDSSGAALIAAFDIKTKFNSTLGTKLQFQIGLSFGPAFVNSVGYAKFKSLVTVGSPMKVAMLLSRLPEFESGAILLDYAMEERVRFHYKAVPAELAHMPNVKSFEPAPKSQRVFVVVERRRLEVDEWMYQLQDGQEDGAWGDWGRTFGQLAAATSLQEAQGLLEDYLAVHPQDVIALRLQKRLPLWAPSLGIAY